MAIPDPHFVRPVPYVKVGSGFGPRDGHFHSGTDIGVATGTPVVAIADGEVIRAQPNDTDDAGINVAVRHPNGMVSRYLHFSRLDVKLGQRVARGQRLGLSGNTGRSSGPHLHFEIRVPEAMLPDVIATVGKPTVGWGKPISIYGWAIPPESWIPTDEVRLSTRAKLKIYGIPLYADRPATSTLTRIPRSAKISAAIGLAVFGVLIGVGVYRRRAS